MRHTRKWEAGSGVGQVIPSGEAEALEEGEKKQAEDLGYYSESDTDSPRTQRHGKREGRLIPPFLPASFFPALAMAEAGAGLSETVTETTVTVTTEPVRKAEGGGGGGGAVLCCLGVWEIPGGRGQGFGKLGIWEVYG
jgi:hypothetical protein